MSKSFLAGLLCFVIFLGACGLNIIAVASQVICHIAGAVTKFVSLSVIGIEPMGDEGGGGRPFAPPGSPQ